MKGTMKLNHELEGQDEKFKMFSQNNLYTPKKAVYDQNKQLSVKMFLCD